MIAYTFRLQLMQFIEILNIYTHTQNKTSLVSRDIIYCHKLNKHATSIGHTQRLPLKPSHDGLC